MTGQQLKSSILQLAVQGKLVPQDPTDEPASRLLARIREEKEQLIREKKIKREKNPSQIFRGDDGHFYERVGKNAPVCIDEELPFEIPETWEWARFSSIIFLISGTSYKKDDVKKTGIRILRGGNIQENSLFLYDDDVFLSASHYEDEKNIRYGDTIFVASTGSKTVIGKPAFIPHDFPQTQIGAFLRIARPINISLAKYVNLIFQTEYYREHIRASVSGTNINNIKAIYVEAMLIPLPPLAEQQRIVAKIEELLPYVERYEQTENKLEKLNTTFPDQLKRSILQEAIQGKLVPQDPADEPASALLERIRTEKEQLIKEGKIKREKNPSHIYRGNDGHFYEQIGKAEPICIDDQLPFDIPESWEWARLENVSVQIGDIDHKMPPTVEANGIPYISPLNFTSNNGIDFENAKQISLEDYVCLSKKCSPEKNDIIFPRYGTIGVVRMVNTSRKFLTSYSCCTIKNSKRFMSPKYVYYVLQSKFIKDEINRYINKTTQPNVGLKSIKRFLFPLPPLAEQQRIVAKLEQLLPLCEHLK